MFCRGRRAAAALRKRPERRVTQRRRRLDGGDADSQRFGGGELEGESQRKKKERGKNG
jgi:hypothetical protein